ncbi:Hsp20/alpha crystallin family protein [Rhodoblastus acidophilus]|uniref:Hsp20/alpha crystallin family protein n=1 Tax=Candidatus Rhodoblastus alkanivorans TaxID=2954117 RepID=A0ABS9Z754_9HYPH|nr:Hsp20/alpha crystallin family protein [Candidatus Rhodoblastus alkanivorans]MCI4679602.1 Hsp20/alpha crystallin family protein [Candidatus Rhodoblastus alkanivorans]MCI4683427.1 Hsp20/alpha crystallin family protein [Candidatus Rhodoblastus alkanivorans]MDI4640737.1 Hsp20/alpha crystallin family protein [Rhodoblastus acidophilus]
MTTDDRMTWMWSEAMAIFSRAERLRDAAPARRSAGSATWEPAVDVVETEAEVLVLVALPGVREQDVEAAIEGSSLVVRGRRGFPPELRAAFVHRLELPRGAFERRISLPASRYEAVVRAMREGLLIVSLRKSV